MAIARTHTKLNILVNYLFYLSLSIELFLMLIEKSEISFPYESYVFRLTFAITLLAVILMKHSKKEWIILCLTWVFTAVCYKLTGKNELLRYATFIMASRDVNIEKTMKYIFYVCIIGYTTIILLSLTNVLGDIYIISDFGRGNTEELRYVLGFGHPNSLFSSAYVILLLWIWLYGKEVKIWHFGAVFFSIIGLYLLTSTRTAMVIGLVTILAAVYLHIFPNIKNNYLPYVISCLIVPIFSVACSIFAAKNSYLTVFLKEGDRDYWIKRLDNLLTNRIYYLYYSNDRHSGSLETWSLFSNSASTEYFDMGWVRIFYWYGIIPGSIITLLIIVFLWCCWKQKDLWTVLLILSLGVYTIIEATFVSRYIGRNILLPVFGVYIGKLLTSSPIVPIKYQKDYQKGT
ncbi:hypothetical protein SAMN02910276_02013 [Butyrivibrio sp. Su6]|uniref:hypothetical protein n=1 Tax=Butyrivibrio sp. Su6 TaxID=1520810 RepID=UPI00089F0D1C|nr:hypothetical protein [Butyrivibrio sp. Su6]SEG15658.1 hypothetical protein SAMN02910276_02013 [Butyrivibrio sp. Su6]